MIFQLSRLDHLESLWRCPQPTFQEKTGLHQSFGEGFSIDLPFRKSIRIPPTPTSSFWAPKTWKPKFDPALEPTASLSRQKLKEIHP